MKQGPFRNWRRAVHEGFKIEGLGIGRSAGTYRVFGSQLEGLLRDVLEPLCRVSGLLLGSGREGGIRRKPFCPPKSRTLITENPHDPFLFLWSVQSIYIHSPIFLRNPIYTHQ